MTDTPSLMRCYYVRGRPLVLLSYSGEQDSSYVSVTGLAPRYFIRYAAQNHYVRIKSQYYKVSDLLPVLESDHTRRIRLNTASFLTLRPVDGWRPPEHDELVNLIPIRHRQFVEMQS